jgi:hypothetical protein
MRTKGNGHLRDKRGDRPRPKPPWRRPPNLPREVPRLYRGVLVAMGFGLVVGVLLFYFGLISGAIEFASHLKRTAVHDATQAVRPTLSATHALALKSQPKIPAT